jgi:hypothetical protein
MKTYLIHARCLRPFIAYLDPVEADTPEEAIAIARRRPEKLIDTAEECNGQYPWDEFAVNDESGNELLHVLDPEARLREAAPLLLEALKDLLGDRPSVQGGVCQYCGRDYISEFLEGNCPSDDCPSFQARAAIAKATTPMTQNDQH